jgi:hypothetical protein
MPADPIRELTRLYRGLSRAQRRALLGALALEGALIALTERDIARRPADRIRGPKLLWRIVATQNVVGPAAYAFVGRRRD